MPHTWAEVHSSALTFEASADVKPTTNNTFTVVYFVTNDEYYQWDGTTVSNLGFNTWATANYTGVDSVDVAWFAGNVYAAFNAQKAGETYVNAKIARRVSGTWSEVYTAYLDGSIELFPTASDGKRQFRYLEADDSRIIANIGGFFNTRLLESVDGTSWAFVEITATVINGQAYLLGKYKQTRRAVVAQRAIPPDVSPNDDFRTIDASTGSFADLTLADIGQRDLMGYLGGAANKSFFSALVSGTTWKLYYSSDWGTNITDAGGPTSTGPPTSGTQDCDFYRIYDVDDTAQLMFHLKNNVRDIYEWDTGTSQWVADNQIDGPSGAIPKGFFRLNDVLYCIAQNGSNVEFFSGGSLATIPTVKLYYDLNALTERATLPFAISNPSGMAVRKDSKVALGGSAVGAGSEIVITKTIADNYAASVDITDSHSIINPVTGLAWVNGDTT